LLNKMLSKVGDLGFRRRVVKLIEYLDINDGDAILDCGCGEGFYTMIISELHDAQITAFDFDTELLKKARNLINNKKNIRFVDGDIAEGLPFEDESFDKIVFSEVLEHLDDDKKALKEIYRVQKFGGVTGLTVPNKHYPFMWDPLNWTREHIGLGHFSSRNTVLGGVWSYDHKRLYLPDEIKALAEEAGFKVTKIETLTHFCFPFNYHILRLGKLFYTRLPVSKGTKESMEKFEWESEKNDGGNSLIKATFNVFKRVDSRNDRYQDLDGTSVSISLRLEK